MLKLLSETPKEWLESVLADFDTFLLDHANCERKVSANNMQFIVRYPDRKEILEPLIRMAREELEHFHQVYLLLSQRGLTLKHDSKDEYINLLLKQVRTGRDERLLDRLLLAGVVEARGCERLSILAEALEEKSLKEFYQDLTRCEARHHSQFLKLAGFYFNEKEINQRHHDFLEYESEAIKSLPIRPALY